MRFFERSGEAEPSRTSIIAEREGVADRGLHEEAVQLGLGQRVGTGLLDGVLGRDDHEGLGGGAAHAVDRHLGLFHDLQKRGLGLGRGTVDLVGQDDLREDGAGVEDPLAPSSG